ncbi:MAG TPA: ATP-binding cassette domain-containing protein [Nocardioidaceae bacterium]|nr:ATP-binding cassette domain-containing protein [Nocardioidaceae bacterium]
MTKAAVELDLETDVHVLRAANVGVLGHGRPLLEPTTLSVRTGEVVVVVGEPGHGHTALALVLGGRLRADAGTVLLDDQENDAKALQRMVALVDVPGVSEPDDAVPLATIVGEEMSMAGLRASRGSVHRWLEGQGIADLADDRIDEIPAAIRTRVLAGLAACREGVRFLVLVLPERVGGLPAAWMSTAGALASLGFGVLVTASPTAAAHVDESLLEWIGSES